MAIITKDTIVFNSEDFFNLLPNYGTSNTANQKGKGLASMRSMNPFRFYGYASPGYAPTDVANVSGATDYLRNGVVNGIYALIVSNGAKIHELDISTTGSLNASPFSITAHGGHTTPVANDCVIYTAKVGGTSASRMFYSWSDNTDWDVGVNDLSRSTSFATASHWDDDFMSTAPATPLNTTTYAAGKGYPHPLIVGDDDILYIGDRNFVHAYDGQNGADNDGKFFPAQMTLPNGYVVTSFAKLPDALVVFAYLENSTGSSYYYLGKSAAFFYGYSQLDPFKVVQLNDNIVTEAFNYKNTIGCFTSGRPKDPSITKTSQLLLWDGSKFEPACAFIGSSPIRGGVDIVGDAIYWNSDGIVHSYGSPLIGAKAGMLKTAQGSGTTSGLLKTFNSTYQFISSGTTTSGGLQYLGDNYYDQTSFSTGLAEPIFPMGYKGKVKLVKVRFAKASTGGRNILIQLKDRYTGSSDVIDNAENYTEVSGQSGAVITRQVTPTGTPFIAFDALKLVVAWSSGSAATDAPILDSVEVFYELIKT